MYEQNSLWETRKIDNIYICTEDVINVLKIHLHYKCFASIHNIAVLFYTL